MSAKKAVVHVDPEIIGGIPVFVGTRVPFATLFDYLKGGQPLADFLQDFQWSVAITPWQRSNKRRTRSSSA
jgi:uncharacterized protein (DUF433 family)